MPRILSWPAIGGAFLFLAIAQACWYSAYQENPYDYAYRYCQCGVSAVPHSVACRLYSIWIFGSQYLRLQHICSAHPSPRPRACSHPVVKQCRRVRPRLRHAALSPRAVKRAVRHVHGEICKLQLSPVCRVRRDILVPPLLLAPLRPHG
jgi:hypothetical protein